MRLKELVDAAETVLREKNKLADGKKKGSAGIALLDLWDDVLKRVSVNKSEREGLMADFYSELLQDPRFVNTGSNRWRLREFISFDEYKRIKGAMYGIENLERVEESARTKEIPSDQGEENGNGNGADHEDGEGENGEAADLPVVSGGEEDE